MAKQTETNVPHPTTIQFTAMYSFVKIGTNPPNTIAVNTSLDKSKKYFAKVSFTVLSQLRGNIEFPFSQLLYLDIVPTARLLLFFLLFAKVSHCKISHFLLRQFLVHLKLFLNNSMYTYCSTLKIQYFVVIIYNILL